MDEGTQRFQQVSYLLSAYLFGGRTLAEEMREFRLTEHADTVQATADELEALLADPEIEEAALDDLVRRTSSRWHGSGRKTIEAAARTLQDELGRPRHRLGEQGPDLARLLHHRTESDSEARTPPTTQDEVLRWFDDHFREVAAAMGPAPVATAVRQAKALLADPDVGDFDLNGFVAVYAGLHRLDSHRLDSGRVTLQRVITVLTAPSSLSALRGQARVTLGRVFIACLALSQVAAHRGRRALRWLARGRR